MENAAQKAAERAERKRRLITNVAEGCTHSTMATWRRRVIQKKGRGSQTPGKQKGGNCYPDTMQRWFARCSRSYKHKDYAAWGERMLRRNKQK